MSINSLFAKIGGLLQNTEMFERPKKKIPGKWSLCEYFVDEGEKLIHLQADDLKAKHEVFDIEFRENDFVHTSTIPIPLIQNIKSGKWDIHKNFISLIDESNFRNTIEFQFAFEKGNLKLLKKDAVGKIEFFGFFKRLPA